MKKFLNVFLAAIIVLSLVGCNKKDEKDKDKDNSKEGETKEPAKELTLAELKEAVRKAGYIVNDYIACSTGLTEDQMEGFTVDIQKSATESSSYCVIMAKSEDYAKQACEAVSTEFNTCVRSGKNITFPENDAPAEVRSALQSIVDGNPKKAVTYDKAE